MTTTTETQSASTSPLLGSLRRDGYVVIPSVIQPNLLPTLIEVSQKATSLARSGDWPHIRTLPKQFPPWPADPSNGIWGVQHLLHPDMPNRSIFASCYFSDSILSPVKELLEVPDGEVGDDRLVMELFNLLVRPERDFQLRWHRDAVPFDGTSIAEEEKLLDLVSDKHGQVMRRTPFHAQYNIPLFPDSSLHLVPGSHLRPRTSQEFDALQKDAHAPSLPGMIEVRLGPGDLCLYDNNIIHRGVYTADAERLTLHGSVGDVAGGGSRARNVLQHAVGDWIHDCGFAGMGEKDRKRAEAMRDRLIALGEGAGAEGTKALHED